MDGQSYSREAAVLPQDSKEGATGKLDGSAENLLFTTRVRKQEKKKRKKRILTTFNDVLVFFQQMSIISIPFILIYKTNEVLFLFQSKQYLQYNNIFVYQSKQYLQFYRMQ